MNSVQNTSPRYAASDLLTFVSRLFEAAGLEASRAAVVAEVLIEGDLMGHSTHGLQLISRHLQGIRDGAIARIGDPAVVADHDAAYTWDGCYLPGPWLVREAMKEGFQRVERMPTVTAIIRRSGHIGCLAAYPRLAVERGLMMLLTTSDPAVRIVAPHGSMQALYTPNPVAAGWPTTGQPVIVDTSPSTTTAGMVGRLGRAGARCSGPWLIGANGVPTDDPAVLATPDGGAILPLGGIELGHKGFAFALIVEALTSALAGFGRADNVKQDGAAVFLQLINPKMFGGLSEFRRETGWLAEACTTAAPRPGQPPVRMPGGRGLALRERQLRDGVKLHDDTLPELIRWAGHFGIPLPPPIGTRDANAIAS
jgi:LDH2 family malate/lactate/ureidoglycolate dehydrogenase